MAKKNLPKTDILKARLIEALTASLGIVTQACIAADCSRETFYKYCREDKDFNAKVKDVDNVALDFAEGKLHESIRNGKEASTIFYLKTKGKKRGYIERTEVDAPVDKQPFRSDATPITFGDESEEDK